MRKSEKTEIILKKKLGMKSEDLKRVTGQKSVFFF